MNDNNDDRRNIDSLDLTGLSRILRSTSIRPSESTSSIGSFADRGNTSCSVAETMRSVSGSSEKIMKLMSTCDDSLSEFIKLQIINDCLFQVARSDCTTMPEGTGQKFKSIIARHETTKYLPLPKDDSTLLGIGDVPKIILTQEDRRSINIVIENLLRKEINNFIVKYELLGGSVSEARKSYESAGIECPSTVKILETDSLRWKGTIDEVCSKYYEINLRCLCLLGQWQRLKYADMKELNLENADDLLLQSKILEAKAKISYDTCALRMFQETPMTLNALKILSDFLTAKIADGRENLRKKKALKISYDDVGTPAYEQILNNYTELCAVIKKKDHLLGLLK